MRTLLTGASGFVGSTLAPTLLAEGHELVALARDPDRARRVLAETAAQAHGGRTAQTHGTPQAPGTAAAREVQVLRGDVLTGEGLAEALRDVEVAFYLIHSMESGAGGRGVFPERERVGARNFAAQARRAGVRRIVYLGGPLPREGAVVSPHLASRAEVERILLEHVPGSVALRASIVIGARSRSFRLLVRLVERLPVLALPAWRTFRTRPIDVRDVVEMLAAAARLPTTAARFPAAAARLPAAAGLILDAVGPETLTYEQLLRRIAEALILPRPVVGLGITATPLAARLAAALAGEDPELVLPLMEGLESDLLPTGDPAARVLGVRLHSLDDAIERALCEWEASEPLAAR